MPTSKTNPKLPRTAKLKTMPSGALSSQHDLTVGRSYKVHGLMGSCWVVDTNVAGETCSIHPDHFEVGVPKRAINQVEVRKVDGVSAFDCRTCAKTHILGVYVAGHWDEKLIHTCTCGAKHSVLRGAVKFVKAGEREVQAA